MAWFSGGRRRSFATRNLSRPSIRAAPAADPPIPDQPSVRSRHSSEAPVLCCVALWLYPIRSSSHPVNPKRRPAKEFPHGAKPLQPLEQAGGGPCPLGAHLRRRGRQHVSAPGDLPAARSAVPAPLDQREADGAREDGGAWAHTAATAERAEGRAARPSAAVRDGSISA
nr:hypothetical protein SHINE37_41094 [Rhizobiaceae bacterium]